MEFDQYLVVYIFSASSIAMSMAKKTGSASSGSTLCIYFFFDRGHPVVLIMTIILYIILC